MVLLSIVNGYIEQSIGLRHRLVIRYYVPVRMLAYGSLFSFTYIISGKITLTV